MVADRPKVKRGGLERAKCDPGLPGTSFDCTLERAIVLLLGTPVSDGTVRLRVGPERSDMALPTLSWRR